MVPAPLEPVTAITGCLADMIEGHSVLNAQAQNKIFSMADALSPKAKLCALVCNTALLPDFFPQS
ncbi:hypothetical protein D3C78_1413300 [compost metagenome]